MALKQYWWKFLGIIIMIYVITAGLLIPLKQGITEVTPTRLKTGAIYNIAITGYNTHFSDDNYRVYLRIDKNSQILADKVNSDDGNHMTAEFAIPNELPDNNQMSDVTLVLIDNQENYSIYPNMRIIQSELGNESITTAWSNVLNLSAKKWEFAFPYRNILVETIRNTFFHVAIWMAMFILLFISLYYSIQYLRSGESRFDHWAGSFTYVSIVFGMIGLVTGSVWARYTWGAFWTNDVKLNMTAISMMIYLAYAILRSSIDDHDKRAKSAAIYNIFAFCSMIPLIMIIPRLTASLHPGNGGNPAMGGEDLDSTLRLVFYPAIIGLALIGGWIAELWYRVRAIEEKRINNLLDTIT